MDNEKYDARASMMAGVRIPKEDKGAPVYDAAGKLIGRTGQEPKVEEVRTEDIMLAALTAEREKHEKVISQALNAAADIARVVEKIRPDLRVLSFAGRLATEARIASAQADIEKLKQVVADELIHVGESPEAMPFRQAVGRHVQLIDSIFKGEK